MTHHVEQIDVLVGLRGCGKTSWGRTEQAKRNEHKPIYQKSCHYIDMRSIWVGPFGRRSSKDVMYLTAENLRLSQESIILENPDILTAQNFLDFILPFTTEGVVSFGKIVFHVWEPNVEACIYNADSFSAEEAERLRSQKVDVSDTRCVSAVLKTEVEIVKHKTDFKPAWKHFCSVNGIKLFNDKYMFSDSWVAGGCYGDADGGVSTAITPEDPIEVFEEFDTLIDKVCPHISLKTYRKITSECCTILTTLEENSDDEIYHSRHVCDMERFYEILNSLNSSPSNADDIEIEIKSKGDTSIGVILFRGPTEADVYEQIKNFKGDEIF